MNSAEQSGPACDVRLIRIRCRRMSWRHSAAFPLGCCATLVCVPHSRNLHYDPIYLYSFVPSKLCFYSCVPVQEDSPCLGLVLVLLYLFKRRWRESMLKCCGFFRQAYIYQYDPNFAASENKLEKVYNRHSAEGSLSNTPLTCFPPFCMLCLKRRL